MSNSITLEVAGTPHGRPRPNARAVKGKNGKYFAQVYQPKGARRGSKSEKAWLKANAWFAAVKAASFGKMPAKPWEGPIRLEIDVFFERPGWLTKKSSPPDAVLHTAKPDRDNLDKAIMDALVQAGLFLDDSQVCAGAVNKFYAAKGCGPGVRIEAVQLEDTVIRPAKKPAAKPKAREPLLCRD